MLKNYLKIALRNLQRHPGYTVINIGGLGVGIACCILILLFVRDEWSYDRFHEHADRLYRVTKTATTQTAETQSASVQLPIGNALRGHFPEIEQVVRLWRDFSPLTNGEYPTVRVGDQQFREEQFFYADSAFFEVFSFALLRGDPTALRRPYEVFLTESTAQKYFGSDDPVGQHITIAESNTDLHVAGVLADAPSTSHLKFDFVASFQTLEHAWTERHGVPSIVSSLWTWSNTWVYVLLAPEADPAALQPKLAAYLKQQAPEEMRNSQAYALQPITGIHLGPQLDASFEPIGSRSTVIAFALIALFILFIACINYMNLATARSLQRAREVGVRKVVGARRAQLVRQFLSEAMLLSAAAGLVSMVVVSLLLPLFNDITGKAIVLVDVLRWPVFAGIAAVFLSVGVLAGAYPAFLLSAFKPAEVLKGTLPIQATRRPGLLRKGLVVMQFTIAVALIAGTGIMYSQVNYLLDKDLGMDTEHRVIVNTQAMGIGLRYKTFIDEVLNDSRVVSGTITESIPGRFVYDYYLHPEGFPMDERISIPYLWTDKQFFEVFDVTFLEGEEATREHTGLRYVLNESAVAKLGWDDPIGKQITRRQDGQVHWEGVVTGVVADFHFRPLHEPIEPLIMAMRSDFITLRMKDETVESPWNYGYAIFRIQPDDLQGALAHMEQTWNEAAPGTLFEFLFLDENLAQLYQAEVRLRQLIGYGALSAILIACLGLFGLVAFMAEQRTKELGVRKVLGATTGNLVLLLSKDLLGLVLIATVIAVPIAYLSMRQWLDAFAYRVPIQPAIFVLAGGMVLLIALLTVSTQAIRAARTNPVDTLRHD